MAEEGRNNDSMEVVYESRSMVEKKLTVPEWNKGKEEILTGKFFWFMGFALVFGILYTFCRYRNPYGITYPLMVAGVFVTLAVMMRGLSIREKKESWFLIGIAILLGISTCRTADIWLIRMNKLGIFLLVIIFVIHQFYDDRKWSVGKYLSVMVVYFFQCIGTVFYPFFQGRHFFRKVNAERYAIVLRVAAGIGCAIPIVMVAGVMLGQADAVFGAVVTYWIDTFFNFGSLTVMFCMTVFGTFLVYCLVAGACTEKIKTDEKMVRTHEPVAAIVCMSLVLILYLFFCGIQIVYLFLGKGSLPDGMTYSAYARQGFFQLLFVAMMNFVMVLLNLKFFKKNRGLNFILYAICGCTYVMIASAAYRMALYVGEYHLTYLRVLVLWFLGLLAVMMAGVAVLICKNEFPLFRYLLVVISVFFLGLSFVRPQRVVAEYNLKRVDEWTQGDFAYMTQQLSADAVPAVVKALEKDETLHKFYSGERKEFCREYYDLAIWRRYEKFRKGIRSYNFSYAAAKRALEKYESGGGTQ